MTRHGAFGAACHQKVVCFSRTFTVFILLPIIYLTPIIKKLPFSDEILEIWGIVGEEIS